MRKGAELPFDRPRHSPRRSDAHQKLPRSARLQSLLRGRFLVASTDYGSPPDPAYEVPEEGGETQFVSARSAYARLSDDMKEKIDPLEVIHDYVFSRSKVAPVDPKHAASLPPITQKLVRRNPNTGAKNFYIGSHAKEIVGWNYEDSRSLLDELLAGSVVDANVYTHAWQPGDLVIWDNRCILHRGTGYDADKYRRFMRQTRVAGLGPTLEE